MTEFEIATLATSIAIGLGQIGIVWYGIRAMTQGAASRALESERQARVQDQRHAEAMQALDMQRQALETLITRAAPTGQ